MQIAIVDDDKKETEYLRTALGSMLCGTVHTYQSGEAFLSAFSAGKYELIVLDIFMSGITGMAVARKIRETDKTARIVFCTSSNEFASESYEVGASYYLHKPLSEERLRAMLDRLNFSEMELTRKIPLPGDSNVVLRDILYADFASHRVTLHCKHGENLIVRAPFSKIEPLLCAYPYFFSPCKGVVINFYEVTAQNGDTFTMSDGCFIPISRRKAKEILDAYSSFRFDGMRKEAES